MEIRNILVATDFSPEAKTAVAHAMAIARHTGAGLVLVHVCPVMGPSEAGDWAQQMRNELAENRARLEELRISLSGQGVTVSHAFIDDLPDEGVIRSANELGVDLVVLGTHGRTGFKRLLLGSVAERVVRGSEKSVLVARPAEHLAGGYRRILVPTDFSAASRQALELATQVVTRGGAIHVHHYWHSPMFGPVPEPEVVVSQRDATASELGAALVEPYSGRDFQVSFMTQSGYVPQGVLEDLERSRYDLVVVGSHGRRGAQRWLLGSVAEATVRHAPCSVLVAKGESPAAPETA